MNKTAFQITVWDYYHAHKRNLPWRQPEPGDAFDPYKILVSEMMLQQTQVRRVIPKYEAFINQFPGVQALAQAPLSAVLTAWSSLGYNRRAKYLHDAAKQLVSGASPWKPEDLLACKGIGPNTAAAVMVYAYNQPHIFIETNIRTVYIHHFFPHAAIGSDPIADKELVALLEQTIDRKNPREFYWALMDYGSFLKTTVGNAARVSKHYAKQSKFDGSRRQIRGQVLKFLTQSPLTAQELEAAIHDERLAQVTASLITEGLIVYKNSLFTLAL